MSEKVYYSTHADLMACSAGLSLSKKYSQQSFWVGTGINVLTGAGVAPQFGAGG